jgi:DNA primase
MNLLELLSRDLTLRKVAGTRGGEYVGPCPWCGGRDRFRVWPYAEKPGYWCRQCGKKDDAIQYLRDREGLSYRETCKRTGRPLMESGLQRPTRSSYSPPLSSALAEAWQARARAFTEACERALWSSVGAKALGYFHQRSLHDETVRAARIGYHATTTWEKADTWGFASDHKQIWLLQGLVFPWLLGNELWRVVIRPAGTDVTNVAKYMAVSGGSNTLYRVDTLRIDTPARVVEGVLDAQAGGTPGSMREACGHHGDGWRAITG